ncbi:MAG: hypothetical protein M1421_05770, partial [Candidatus Eremiobacteraeota bacterium]|nr:hypothetical protein [Candidatus Eremiobacteraeota bacterium]
MTSITKTREAASEKGKGLKKLTSRDLFLIKLIEDCRISPNGEEILYVVKRINPEKNEYQTHLELLPFH